MDRLILTRIQELCKIKGISIAELERITSVGNGVIRRWKTSIPRVDKLQKVAEILDTTIDYLVTGEDIEIEQNRILIRKVSSLTSNQLTIVNMMIEELSKVNE